MFKMKRGIGNKAFQPIYFHFPQIFGKSQKFRSRSTWSISLKPINDERNSRFCSTIFYFTLMNWRLNHFDKFHGSVFEPHALPDGDLDLGDLHQRPRQVLGGQRLALGRGRKSLLPATSDESLDGLSGRLLDLGQREVGGEVGLGAADEAADPRHGRARVSPLPPRVH